jgi:hypothetical protein
MRQGITFPTPTFENIAPGTHSEQSSGKTVNQFDKLNAGTRSTDPLSPYLEDKKLNSMEDYIADLKRTAQYMFGSRSPERDNTVPKGEQKSREESIPPKKTEASDKSDPK